MSLGGGRRSGSALDLYLLRHRKDSALPNQSSQRHPNKRTQDWRPGRGRLRAVPVFSRDLLRPGRVSASARRGLAPAGACCPYIPPAARMANEMQMNSPPIWRELSQRNHFSKPSSQWIAKWSVSCKMCNPPPRPHPSPPPESSLPPPPAPLCLPPSQHKMHSFTFLQNVRGKNLLSSWSWCLRRVPLRTRGRRPADPWRRTGAAFASCPRSTSRQACRPRPPGAPEGCVRRLI